MDKNFTFRFYDVVKPNSRSPLMVDLFRHIAGISDKKKREQYLAQDYTVRLENLDDDGPDAVVGELTRCQNTNLPAEISAGRRSALQAERLGHSIVFRLNHKIGALGIQYDTRVISPGRILDYLASFNSAAIYRIDPRINQDAWQKFNSGQVRKFKVRIHNPDDMGSLSGAGSSASAAFKAMGEAYDAPSVYVELSMGHRRGFLSGAINGLAAQLAAMNFPGVNLDKMSAVVIENDETHEFDLIEDRLVSKDTLSIDDRDPDKNWEIKKAFLCREMKKLIG